MKQHTATHTINRALRDSFDIPALLTGSLLGQLQ
jgi:alanyl-tRNA synthetase